jgi:hypothetical protein
MKSKLTIKQRREIRTLAKLPERRIEMRKEYKRSDFAKLERGKFHEQAVAGTHVILLEPMLAKAFPTSESVNEALSGLLALAKRTTRLGRRSSETRGG